MYERFLNQLWFSVPFLVLLMATGWFRNRAIRKGRITREHFEEILSQVRAVLIVVAVLTFCVYYVLSPHPPW